MSTLETLWHSYQAGGYEALRDTALLPTPENALALFYRALLAFGAGDLPQAAQYAQAAAEANPASHVYREAARYVQRVQTQGKARVYVDGDAFAAFIRGGGNVPLYAAASAALRERYAGYEALRLLDIGVGDGLALLPALPDNLAALTLVEPSEPMLSKTVQAIGERGLSADAHHTTIQAFMASSAGRQGHWDIVQATWSLQSVPPDARPSVLAWMHAHGQRALIVEFDVPQFSAMFAPERVRYVAERYERGLAEYAHDRSLVAQGFLMPVMFGYFDRSAARTNWEGPIESWADALRAAGFSDVRTHKLYAYFWADAYLLDAR